MSAYGTLINSVNLYLDSSDEIHQGDDINMQLGGQALHCQDGQNFKLVLTEFTMFRPQYTINTNNNKFQLTYVANGNPFKRTPEKH